MVNKRLLKEASFKKLYLPVSALHSIFSSLFVLFNAYLLALIVNSVFLEGKTFKDVQFPLVLFLCNAALRFIFNFFIENLIKKSSEDIKERIKEKAFHLILSSNPYKMKEEKSGEILNLLTEGAESLTPYYSQYLPQFFSSVLSPITICIFVMFQDRLSALILLITYPIIPLFMILIGNKSKELNEKQWKRLAILSSHFLDMLQGLRTLKMFGRSRLQEEKVFKVSESYRNSTMDVLKVSFLSALVLELAATISTAVVAVNLGLRLVYNQIDFLNAFFILVVAPDFYSPLRQLGTKFHASLNGVVAIEKIETLEHAFQSEVADDQNFSRVEARFELQIKNLSFSHESKEALHNINFEIHPGEKVALIGESGSGKSTLLSLLSGFLSPDENMIFINNRDINYIDKESYIKHIAIVPQFPHIFNMSIEDNILLGEKNVSTEKFLKICKLTRIDQFADSFPDKYKTQIGDGEDIAISGGEKQRIALARALIKDAQFIIMDEPSSALDPESEELISNLIQTALADKTLLIAAHRLNTIRSANKILVLEKGSLTESGDHDHLLKLKGRYYTIMKTVEEML